MATLQKIAVSAQYKNPICARIRRSHLPSPRPLNLSFFTASPALNLSFTTNRRSSGGGALGARMSATAADTYAVALADLATANNTLDTTCADVEKIEQIFSDPKVFDFFVNPIIELEKKRQVADDIAKSYGLQPHAANFLNLLIDSDRIDLIKEIIQEFELVYNKLTDTELAVVTAVVKLESQQLAQIAKQVQKMTGKKNVRIKSLIDPSLVAGFTVRFGTAGSRFIDMSLKKQLEEITAQFDAEDLQFAE